MRARTSFNCRERNGVSTGQAAGGDDQVRLEGAICGIVRGGGIRVWRKRLQVSHHLTIETTQKQAMELPEPSASCFVKNPFSGIQTPMKAERQTTLKPRHLKAQSIQGLQILERSRASFPAGLAVGGVSNVRHEAAVAPPGHDECQAQECAEPRRRRRMSACDIAQGGPRLGRGVPAEEADRAG